ncbi:MAG TPA: ATP-binding cassette domain-containing protein [Methylomirabilota bacterium]|nr:ATP-binding cassette domain-containing protein [Methylomirabilota bacterium]
MTAPARLRTERLTRSFGSLLAVDAVDFEVPPGELRAIIGPNGAGKSTFFKLISDELAPTYMLYFFHTLFSHGNLFNVGAQRQSGYVREEGLGWLRPENRDDFLRALQGFRRVTMEDLKRNERLCWGAPADVRDALIGLADALGAGTLLLQFNQGAMPHEMFVNPIRRFAAEVLPAVRRHTVTKVAIG